MSNREARLALRFGGVALLVVLRTQSLAQGLPQGITREELATNNKLFLALAGRTLEWEEPAEPVRIAGPIY